MRPVSGFDENGSRKPGTFGRASHLGDPLTAEEIRQLPDGAEVTITSTSLSASLTNGSS